MRSKERREFVRVNYLCECQVESEGLRTAALDGRINDLSLDGVFIDSMLWLPIGSTLKVKFKVQDRQIRAIGEVKYFIPNVGMGVQFVDLAQYEREVIESVVQGTPLPALPPPTGQRATGSLIPRSGTGPLTPGGPVMSGDLAVVNLFDVLHMIESGGLTGCLSVLKNEMLCEIHFNDGAIVGASEGSSIGMTALNRILGGQGQAFEFHESPEPFAETIKSSGNTSLLLEMMIHKDEEAPARPA